MNKAIEYELLSDRNDIENAVGFDRIIFYIFQDLHQVIFHFVVFVISHLRSNHDGTNGGHGPPVLYLSGTQGFHVGYLQTLQQ